MTDLCLLNGASCTQDPDRPRAMVAAIPQGRFVAVGDDDEIRNLIQPGTRVIDLEDRWVLPGLSDALFHFYDWALGLQRLPLADTFSLADLRGRPAQRVSETPLGDWIVGQGGNETRWPTPRLPTRANLDEVAPQQDAVLLRSDLHLAVVNSQALREAGLSGDTPDPPDGVIDRVRTVIPPPTVVYRR